MLSSPNYGMSLMEGDLALYRGRLVEVLQPWSITAPLIVELVDEGEISWRHEVWDSTLLSPAAGAEDNVLDMIDAVANEELTPTTQLFRLAEVFLADPRPGDVFRVERHRFMEIKAVRSDGRIGAVTHELPYNSGIWRCRTDFFTSAAELRRHFADYRRPVYWVFAIDTRRPDLDYHPALHARRGSPLCSWKSSHAEHCRGRR